MQISRICPGSHPLGLLGPEKAQQSQANMGVRTASDQLRQLREHFKGKCVAISCSQRPENTCSLSGNMGTFTRVVSSHLTRSLGNKIYSLIRKSLFRCTGAWALLWGMQVGHGWAKVQIYALNPNYCSFSPVTGLQELAVL